MASFIFEEGSQNDATNFTSNDKLIFKQAQPTSLGVTFTAATGLTNSIVTLTFGSQSLQFGADQLGGASTANNLTFLVGNGVLKIGTTGNDSTATVGLDTNSLSAAYGLGGADTINISGNVGHVVDGGTGADSITVMGTTVTDYSGAYIIQGGDGVDIINAANATGNLHIYGATAVNPASTDGADNITLGTGSSYVQGNAGADTIVDLAGTGKVNRINGGADNDTITISGNNADSINGNAGSDSITVNGGTSNEYIRGGQGDDSINLAVVGNTANSGNNQIFGDLGNDLIALGSGISVVSGGAGNDIFIFGANSAQTTYVNATSSSSQSLYGFTTSITDLTVGSDKIDLQQINGTGSSVTQGTGTGVTQTAANLILQATGTTFTNVQAAYTYAQQLLDNAGADATLGKHNIALVQVGADTYSFSHEASTVTATTTSIDTVIKLNGITASAVTAATFI